MKIVLAGTPNFSVETFEEIIKHFQVILIICQPDKHIGRKKILTPPATKLLANKYDIPVLQPNKIKDISEELSNLDFDIFLTMAYGQIIPESILKLAKLGSYNVHGSLLPKYRGAAPIQYAIMNNEKETGITFMEMVKQMDAGDIIFQSSFAIEEDDNADIVFEKMSKLSANCIVKWLNKIKNNQFKKIKQDEKNVSFCPKILPSEEKIELDSMETTLNKIRALSSSPGAYIIDPTTNKRIKIFKASKTFVKNAIKIPCSNGILYGIIYQIEGKNKVFLK